MKNEVLKVGKCINVENNETRQMAWLLTALAALADDPGLVPVTYTPVQSCLQVQSGDPMPSSSLQAPLRAGNTHTHPQANISHKTQIGKAFFKRR